jgi:hypothetical protein
VGVVAQAHHAVRGRRRVVIVMPPAVNAVFALHARREMRPAAFDVSHRLQHFDGHVEFRGGGVEPAIHLFGSGGEWERED